MGLSQVISLILEGSKLLPINSWILGCKGIKWLPSNGIYIKHHLSTFTLKYSVSYQWVKITKWFLKNVGFLHVSQIMKASLFATLETELFISHRWVTVEWETSISYSLHDETEKWLVSCHLYPCLSHATWCLYLLLQLSLDSWPSNKDKFLMICPHFLLHVKHDGCSKYYLPGYFEAALAASLSLVWVMSNISLKAPLFLLTWAMPTNSEVLVLLVLVF